MQHVFAEVVEERLHTNIQPSNLLACTDTVIPHAYPIVDRADINLDTGINQVRSSLFQPFLSKASVHPLHSSHSKDPASFTKGRRNRDCAPASTLAVTSNFDPLYPLSCVYRCGFSLKPFELSLLINILFTYITCTCVMCNVPKQLWSTHVFVVDLCNSDFQFECGTDKV